MHKYIYIYIYAKAARAKAITAPLSASSVQQRLNDSALRISTAESNSNAILEQLGSFDGEPGSSSAPAHNFTFASANKNRPGPKRSG